MVDDEQLVLNAMARVLRRRFKVDCANSSADAIRNVRDRCYDVVVTDILMPNTDGLDMYHTIVAEQPSMHGAFLFVSGSLEACLDPRWPIGAPMLLKPVDHLDLIPAIHTLASARGSSIPPP